MSTNTQSLDTLANEVWNFVGDAADHDLPPLWSAEITRHATDPGWMCRVRVDGEPTNSAALYEAINAYARYWGVKVQFGKPYPGSLWPSRQQRDLTVEVSYMGVSILLYVLVDAEFEPEQVYATGPFAALILGQDVTA